MLQTVSKAQHILSLPQVIGGKIWTFQNEILINAFKQLAEESRNKGNF